MRKQLAILLSFSFLFGPAIMPAQDVVITVERPDKEQEKEQDEKQPFAGKRPGVDMAILLDTSNSMDGLISQAKNQLWTIVQQFARAKKAGKTPVLRVAVFEYGNTRLPASEGYIRQVTGLTDDLDVVSESLFALTTQGGDEYCGQVIGEAITRLDWSDEPNAYKAIFIAGNEPFTQGPVKYQKTCKRAIENGILVNTIHCGDYSTGVNGKWKHGAQMAEGEFMNINQDRAVVAIKTPQDKILIELNRELNRTYLWYGQKDVRQRFMSNQIEQDRNSMESLGVTGLSNRAAVKGSAVYGNVGRDLVDSYNRDKSVMLEIKDSELPEALRRLPAGESRTKFVKEMAAKRGEIQKKIAEANRLRSDFIAKESKKLAADTGESTLGDAVQMAINKQMKASGFEFEK